MISNARRQLLDALEEISEVDPEFRFGQLIANLSYVALGPTQGAIWEAEDEQLLEAARQHLENRRESRAQPVPADVS